MGCLGVALIADLISEVIGQQNFSFFVDWIFERAFAEFHLVEESHEGAFGLT
jgi:hypothetical protein